ncbi:MAG: hypothetical protein GX096_03760 [Clostridiales bacterium]|nr:hypothetical protein [Clostridiales bacterium]
MQNVRKVSNYVTYYLRILLYMFSAFILYLLACAPLASLFIFDEGSMFRNLWLLTPVLFIFLILPLRFSFADALVQDSPVDRKFLFDKAFSFNSYIKKFDESMLHLLNVIKWGIPFFAATGGFLYCYFGMGFSEMISLIIKVGEGLTGIWHAIANFFITLFGSIHTLGAGSNPMLVGISAILVLIGITILIWLYGIVRNSATRYIWVIAKRKGRGIRQEVKSRLKGRRLEQFLVSLLNLVLLLPFLLVVAYSMRGVLSDLSTTSMLAIARMDFSVLSYADAVAPLLLAFFLLYLPLLPARRYLTAAFAVRGNRRQKKNQETIQTESGAVDKSTAQA